MVERPVDQKQQRHATGHSFQSCKLDGGTIAAPNRDPLWNHRSPYPMLMLRKHISREGNELTGRHPLYQYSGKPSLILKKRNPGLEQGMAL